VLRSVLVHPSSCVLFHDWPIHPCNWLFRPRLGGPRLHLDLPFLLHGTLSWL
jgi:hypothetical protein